jgi:hypothetical protein
LIERACFSVISALSRIPDEALRVVLAFDGRGHDLVEGGLHAKEFELTHAVMRTPCTIGTDSSGR